AVVVATVVATVDVTVVATVVGGDVVGAELITLVVGTLVEVGGPAVVLGAPAVSAPQAPRAKAKATLEATSPPAVRNVLTVLLVLSVAGTNRPVTVIAPRVSCSGATDRPPLQICNLVRRAIGLACDDRRGERMQIRVLGPV